jgi:hypothetical protein
LDPQASPATTEHVGGSFNLKGKEGLEMNEEKKTGEEKPQWIERTSLLDVQTCRKILGTPKRLTDPALIESMTGVELSDEEVCVWIYDCGLHYSENKDTTEGKYSLTIGNASYVTDDLSFIENELIEYGQAEGLLPKESESN